MTVTKTKVWETVKKYAKRYFLDGMSAMALGLFASLIIGLIISQLAQISFLSFLAPISEVLSASSPVVGAAIGVAVGMGLKVPTLAALCGAATGAFGYTLGGPVGAFIAATVSAEVGRVITGKTKVDIVLVPLASIIAGGLITLLVGPAVDALMTGLGNAINSATELQPLPMGIIVSVSMGMILTLPISSAALSIMMGLSGIAAGAATVGCSAQMVGFAVMSFRENRWGGLIAQGLGTSMLQVPNIFRKPILWLPTILSSAILGPVSTMVFHMENSAIGAGMGTSGLVGQISMWGEMFNGTNGVELILTMLFMHVILPGALTLLFSEIMRKIGWIKEGELLLREAV